jgi:hypothetical protein
VLFVNFFYNVVSFFEHFLSKIRYNNRKEVFTMKKFFILLLLFFICLPVYSATSSSEKKSCFYDDSECQNYSKKLHEEYDKKYFKQVGPHEYVDTAPKDAYQKEVLIPYLKFRSTHQPKLNR